MITEPQLSVRIEAIDADSLKEATQVQATIMGDKDAVLAFLGAAVEASGAQAEVQRLQ